MTLRTVDGLPGPPRGARAAGALDRLVVESDLLQGGALRHDPLRQALRDLRLRLRLLPAPERPGEALLPFDVRTGRIGDEVWERWLALDPVRMAPRHADALPSMRRIHLDAGTRDEWFLDLGAQAFALEPEALGVQHTLELFDAAHGGIGFRYPGAVRELVLALGR